ncbi:MAG: inorganic pyrophosphatase Ppa [Desulfobacteraceae bacterium]|nr:MAG: inorganic pyrophosphatase Ppa [Desulfobacteraceae bacterium]
MTTSLLIKETKNFEIEAFRRPSNIDLLKKTHVAFSGAPRKHWHDPSKVVLVVDPFSRATFYYEFRIQDIDFIQEHPNLVNPENEIIPMVRIWVKKRSLAVRCIPFIVDETI